MGILKFYQKVVARGGIQGDIIGDAGSVGTAELADLAVTEAKLGALAVATAKIDLLAVTEAQLGALACETAKIDNVAVTEAKIALASLTGLIAALVADANVIGGLMVVHRILLASGADADVDVLLTHKTRIIDAVFTLKAAGTAGSTIGIENVTTAISDVIDVSSGADLDVFRPITMDDAQIEIAAATNLRIAYASSGADFPGAEGYIIGMRVA